MNLPWESAAAPATAAAACRTSMSRANALLVVPEDRPVVEAGETLHALPFGDAAGLTTEFAL